MSEHDLFTPIDGPGTNFSAADPMSLFFARFGIPAPQAFGSTTTAPPAAPAAPAAPAVTAPAAAPPTPAPATAPATPATGADADLIQAFRAARDLEERQYAQRTGAGVGLQLLGDLSDIRTAEDKSKRTLEAIKDQIKDLKEIRDQDVDIEFAGEQAKQALDASGRRVGEALAQDPTRAAQGIAALGRETQRVMEEGELAAETQRQVAETTKDLEATKRIGDLRVARAEEEAIQKDAKRQKGLAIAKAAVGAFGATRPKTATRRLEDQAARLTKRSERLERRGKDDLAQEALTEAGKLTSQAELLQAEQIRRARALAGLQNLFGPRNF